MNTLLVQGFLINTNRSYVKFSYSKETSVVDSLSDDCLYIKFRRGFRSTDIIDKKLEIVEDRILESTDFIKTFNPVYDLNGLKFKKIIPTDYVFSQVLVKDLTCLKMLYDEYQCQILIPYKWDFRLDKYIQLIQSNPYLRVLCDSIPKSIKNFYTINLSNRPIVLESGNDFVFGTKQFYERYLLKAIDSQQSFISQLKNLAKDYGVDIISLPIDETVSNTSYITYRFTELDKQIDYRTGFDPLDYCVLHTSHIEFELTTPSLELLTDFKIKYQNYNLISNFTVFHTKDALGRDWSGNAQWSPISTDFNQDYDTDTQGNLGFKGSFSVDITYNIVYDKVYYDIQKILIEVITNEQNFKQITIE